jgi:hypothetical protein
MRERNMVMVRVCLLVTTAMIGKGQQICHLLCSLTRPLENIIPVWEVQKSTAFYRTRILNFVFIRAGSINTVCISMPYCLKCHWNLYTYVSSSRTLLTKYYRDLSFPFVLHSQSI